MKTFPTKLLINGEFHSSSSGRTLPQINPANEESFAEVESADEKDIDRAVSGGHRAYVAGWKGLAPDKRAELLFEVARLVREHREELALLETRNIGKPIRDARSQVLLGARIFEYYAGAVSRLCGQTIPVAGGGFDFTLREPMGVVAAIAPWNFPFAIAAWKAAPALAAGNCVVLKPASQSPLSALYLGQLALEAGLPPGVLQVVPGSGKDIGDALVTHPLIRKISFTGSTEIGSRLMSLAAQGIKRVSLELGGKSPNIVFADADWERAARESPLSVFDNTGQDCCARSRMFIERPIFDEFVSRFVESTRALTVGDPEDETTRIGPLVSAGQRVMVETFVNEARKLGREVIAGGERPCENGYFLNPAILVKVEVADRIWQEEVFGPVVCLRPFDKEEDMLEEANDSPYGLSGSIWTRDLQRGIRVARSIEAGVLSINSHSSVHVEAPFGGYKQSGIGRDLGMAAMEGYTELKNVYVAET